MPYVSPIEHETVWLCEGSFDGVWGTNTGAVWTIRNDQIDTPYGVYPIRVQGQTREFTNGESGSVFSMRIIIQRNNDRKRYVGVYYRGGKKVT